MVQHIDENDKDTEECIDFPWSELCHWDIDTRFEKSFSKMEINFSEKKIILE